MSVPIVAGFATAMSLLDIIEKGIKAYGAVREALKAAQELTPDQEKQLRAREDSAMTAPHWKPEETP